MTKSQALYEFFSKFMTAYPSTAVPDDRVFPYLTYENIVGNAGDLVYSMIVNLWFYTSSEAVPNAKAEEISKAIGLGGVTIPYDEGVIWIKRGEPWATSMNDDTNTSVKRRLLNLEIEVL